MLSKIKLFLGALSFAGVVGKLGFLGGPIGAIAGAVATFFVQIVKWFFEGVTVIVSNPVTLVTVALAAALSFGSGVKLGKQWDQHLVDRKEAVIQRMILDGKRVDATKKAQIEKAINDAKAAVAAEMAKPSGKPVDAIPVEPAKPAAVRVRKPKAGEGPRQVGGPSVQWFENIFGISVKN